MTIKDRIHEALSTDYKLSDSKEELEQVIEEIAIKFAEWLWTDSHLKSEGIFMTITMKELFELFKKENNL